MNTSKHDLADTPLVHVGEPCPDGPHRHTSSLHETECEIREEEEIYYRSGEDAIEEKYWRITKENIEEGKRTINFEGFIKSNNDDRITTASDNVYKLGCRYDHSLSYWVRTLRSRNYEVCEVIEDKTKLMQVPPHEGGPGWWASPQIDTEKVYGLLVTLRSMLHTMLRDTSETLQRPSRNRTIERQIKKINEILEK